MNSVLLNRKLHIAWISLISFCLMGGVTEAVAQDEVATDIDPDSTIATPAEDTPSQSAPMETTARVETSDNSATPPASSTNADKGFNQISEKKQAVYSEYKKAAERYHQEVQRYKIDLRRTLMSDYQERLSSVDQAYAEKIQQLRNEEAAMRMDVIQRMEEFLRRYGETHEKSADIIYRLARLYYEEADDIFLNDTTGTLEYPDFTKTLDMIAKLEKNFPEYYQMDGALYLKGYCLQQMNRDEESRDAFVELLERYPNTTRRAEVLTRIGEFYFGRSQDAILGFGGEIMWTQALSYYTQAVDIGPSTSVYDRALYRKAWTEYYTDDYDNMIRDFITLVGYADKDPNGSALRTEAIDFMAAALAEEDWDLSDDVAIDPDYGMTRFNKYLNTGEPFESEVLRKFADTLTEQARYEYAADAYEAYLNRGTCEEDIPEVIRVYIGVLKQSGQFERAAHEQAKISERIGENSEWYKCQEKNGNLEALAQADTSMQNALKNSIIAYHDMVTLTEEQMHETQYIMEDTSLSEAEREAARQKYKILAEKYRDQNAELARITNDFITHYPNDEENYNYRYLLGQAWFYAEEYQKSIDAFMVIRDVQNARFQSDTARYIADAYELLVLEKSKTDTSYIYALSLKEIANRINDGQLSLSETPKSLLLAPDALTRFSEEDIAAAREAKKCTQDKITLPDDVTKLVEAREIFSAIENASPDIEQSQRLAPQYRYDNAMIYYNYGDFEEAEKRLMMIIDNNPESAHAVSAADLILDKYDGCNQLDRVAELSEKFASMNLGSGDGSSDEVLAARFNDQKYQALFKIAFQLFNDKKYLEAGAEFLRIIEENPTFEHNHIALYNAAFAYEQLKYYDSSMQLYRRVLTEYGDTKEAVNALYKIGENAEKFFDYETAVSSFLSLYNNKSEHYQNFNRRVDALRQAARIKLLTEDQKGAADLLVRYHNDFPGQPDAPAFLYQAGRVYAEIGRMSDAQKTFSELRRKYSSDLQVRPYIIASYVIEARYHRSKNTKASLKTARDYFETAVTLYQNAPNSAGDLGRMNAAEAAYSLVDMDREIWAATKIHGKMKSMIEQLQKHMAEMQQLSLRFSKVSEYGIKTWALAASYQRARMIHDTVDMLENIERPSDVRNGSDNHLAFLSSMSEMATGARDIAIQAYKQTIDDGRYVPGGSEWTVKSVDGLKQLDKTASSLERMMPAVDIQNPGNMISNEAWQQHLEAEKAAAEAEKAAMQRATGVAVPDKGN